MHLDYDFSGTSCLVDGAAQLGLQLCDVYLDWTIE